MKKIKIGILDVIIVSVIIIAISLAVVYFNSDSTETSVMKIPDITYKVEIKSVPNENVGLFKVGDKLNDSVKGGSIGKIINVDIHDNVEIREDTINDRFVSSSFNNKKDVILTVKGKPTTNDKKHIRFGSVNVKVGEMLYMTTDKYTYSGYIIEMEKIVTDSDSAEEDKK